MGELAVRIAEDVELPEFELPPGRILRVVEEEPFATDEAYAHAAIAFAWAKASVFSAKTGVPASP